MKKLVCLMAGMLASALAFAGSEWENASVQFRSYGPDTYKDGTPVLDGEFYALVWVPTGTNVPSFFANGEMLTGSGCKILTAGPWAVSQGCGQLKTKSGKTTRIAKTVSIPLAQCNTLVAGGTFRLCLLDTRKADGSLASSASVTGEFGDYQFPTTVNGYETTAEVTGDAAAIATTVGITSPISIVTVSKVPDGVKPPVIVGMTFRGEGDARVMDIEVEYTYEYLQYTVAGGATVGTIGKTAATGATAADGDQTKRIVITVPAKGDSNFYRVIRK